MGGFRIEQSASASVVTLAGDLTAPLVPPIQAAVKDELSKGAREVVFDLRHTEVLDSSGIGLLIATSNSLAKVSGVVRTVNTSANILQLLQSMRLTGRLNATGRAA